MKLLMISGDRTLASGRQGAFSAMLEEFSKHWERIDIICPRVSSPIPGPSPEGGRGTQLSQNVFIHASPHSLWRQPRWIRDKGTELVSQHHHDVMTVHEYPPFYNGLGGRMLKKKIAIPAALELHHIVGWPIAASLSELIGRTMTRLFIADHASHFEAVRTVNATVKNLLIEWGVNGSRISVVPSVYLDHALLETAEHQQKKYDLVFCARLADNKGLLETIDALALLPDKKLLIIGDGLLRERAQKRINALGIAGRVTMTGWLPSAEDVMRSLGQGKAFVMNSKSEGNPRVAVEAMAAGLPVLATRVGIMPDIVRDNVNGFFIDGTAQDLAAKAQTLLADEAKRVAMGNEATNVKERFEKRAAIKAYADFLKSVTVH